MLAKVKRGKNSNKKNKMHLLLQVVIIQKILQIYLKYLQMLVLTSIISFFQSKRRKIHCKFKG